VKEGGGGIIRVLYLYIYICIFSLFSSFIINQRPLENQLQGPVHNLAEGLPLYMCVNKIK
jgi:ABC-type microcin C transport system permease subunit YejE